MQQKSSAIDNAKFDEKLGFITKFRTIHDSGMYICRPKDQNEPEYFYEITVLPSCEFTFHNFFTSIFRFGGVNNKSKNNKISNCFTWNQWWIFSHRPNKNFNKRDLSFIKNMKRGVLGFNNGGGGDGDGYEEFDPNFRPRPGFDYVNYDDDEFDGNTTSESLLSVNNNNLTSINNSSEINNGTNAEKGV